MDVINNQKFENLILKIFTKHVFLNGHADYDHARFRYYVLTEYIYLCNVMSSSGIMWILFMKMIF